MERQKNQYESHKKQMRTVNSTKLDIDSEQNCGHMRRNKIEDLVTTGKIKVEIKRGIHRSKYLDGLATWHGQDKHTQLIHDWQPCEMGKHDRPRLSAWHIMIVIIFFISVAHFSSDVIHVPSYLNFCTCSKLTSFTLIIHLGPICFFHITISSVFLLFKLRPI